MLRDIGTQALELKTDWRRRLRNAVVALASLDCSWMTWIEHEINIDEMSLIQITRLIEVRARTLLLKHYNYFGRENIGDLIFRPDWCFTDSGALSAG